MRFGIGRGVWLGAAAGLAAMAAIAAFAATPDEVIAERRAGYKHQGEVFKAMKDGIESGADVKQFADGAGESLEASHAVRRRIVSR